jgi:hypothetical protein
MADRIFDAVDIKKDSAFLANGTYLTSTLDTAEDVGVIMNRTFITGVITLGEENGFLGNWLISGSATFDTGDNTGVIVNHLDSEGDIEVGSNSAFLANRLDAKGDITGQAGVGILLNYAESTGDILATGANSGLLSLATTCDHFTVGSGANAIAAGLDTSANMSCSGSAIFVGSSGRPSGTGQAIAITDVSLIESYMPTLDGKSYLRTGMFMDSKAIHMFNQYGHTGYTGDGSTLALGVEASGQMTSPQWAMSIKGQSRSGDYIIDLASQIHHNLPGEIE